jgi:hypothetical protein
MDTSPRFVDINGATEHSSLGRTTILKLIRESKLASRLVGKKRLIDARDLDNYILALPIGGKDNRPHNPDGTFSATAPAKRTKSSKSRRARS